MGQVDYYQVLGVEEHADPETIKTAFRDLALKYHPDRNQDDPQAAEKMKAVNEAYAVLSNPGKRQEYDAMRKQFGSTAYTHFRSTYSDQDIFRGSDINAVLEEMARAFGLRGYEDLFKEFYGQSYRTFQFGRPGFFAKGFVFTGPFGRKSDRQVGEKSLFQKHVGTLSRYFLEKMAGGQRPQDGPDMQDVIYLSPELAEQGGPYAYFHREKKKKLIVKIPPKVREGQRIRLAGMGHEGKGGANSGNLYLEVRLRMPFIQKIKSFFSSLNS